MFLKQSLVLVVVALLLVEANTSNDRTSGLTRRHSDKHGKETEKVKIKVHEKEKVEDKDGKSECRCGQYKEVMKKVMTLLKAYGSKELIPDLQMVAKKTVDYFLKYMSEEKPEQLKQVHGFLESSTKVCGNFVSGRRK